jgi:predicted CopG family antitoxin
MKSRHTISVNDESFKELQKLVKNVSGEIDTFIKRRVAELAGRPADNTEEYEALKAKHIMLVGQVAKMIKRLSQEADNYDKANTLLEQLGMKPDMTDTAKIIPTFLATWVGSREFAHMYVTLIELAKDKKDIERKLSEIRSAKPVVFELPTRDSAAVLAAS